MVPTSDWSCLIATHLMILVSFCPASVYSHKNKYASWKLLSYMYYFCTSKDLFVMTFVFMIVFLIEQKKFSAWNMANSALQFILACLVGLKLSNKLHPQHSQITISSTLRLTSTLRNKWYSFRSFVISYEANWFPQNYQILLSNPVKRKTFHSSL